MGTGFGVPLTGWVIILLIVIPVVCLGHRILTKSFKCVCAADGDHTDDLPSPRMSKSRIEKTAN